MDKYEFHETAFFIFPLWAAQPDKLESYLTSQPDWESVDPHLPAQYLLYYAPGVDRAQDDRLRVFRYAAPQTLPLYLFDETIRKRLQGRGQPYHEGAPTLQEIRLYLFSTNIAFLEFSLRYDGMQAAEIAEFTYLFRSLRHDEGYIGDFPQGSISLNTAIDRILPESQSGTKLCFSHAAPLKRQANVFTVLRADSCAVEPDGIERFCRLLAHGYNTGFSEFTADETMYELNRCFGGDTFWGGSQDGLTCIVNAEPPHPYQFMRLCTDYHTAYLLLLNQRFAAIADIEAFSQPDIDLPTAVRLHADVVELKTRYSFRVISDDRHIQTIYREMYRIFELDHLLQDLEDANDQLSVLRQARHQKRERFIEVLLTALSVLVVFSALIDLSDYLDRFHIEAMTATKASLLVTLAIPFLAIAGYGIVLIIKNRGKRK